MRRFRPWAARLVGLALLAAAAACTWQGLRPADDGAKRLVIAGDCVWLEDRQIIAVASPYLAAGFFAIDVEGLRSTVAALPWVAEARVRRRWPNRLTVHVREHVPVARWRDDALLTADGTIIRPQILPAAGSSLPRLSGPPGTAAQLRRQLRLLQAALSPVDARIARLHLSARGAWTATLATGLALRLGRVDIAGRVQRFADYGPPRIGERLDTAGYVDLRYDDGFAVGGRRPLRQGQAKGA